MGLSKQSTGISTLKETFNITKTSPEDKVIALAGNPNVGKSTVFNSLTGLKQHTGNWPGKTVVNAQGRYRHKDKTFIMVDLPGTYSLMASSVEEEVARNFICFGKPDATVIVTDATCLERNLNLVMQTLEITDNVVLCVNLIDEAKKKKINIDCNKLAEKLGIPVVPTNARSNKNLNKLMDEVYNIAYKNKYNTPLKIVYDERIEKELELIEPVLGKMIEGINARWVALKLLDGDKLLMAGLNEYLHFDIEKDKDISSILQEAKDNLVTKGIGQDKLSDIIVSEIVQKSENICKECVHFEKEEYNKRDRKIDKILTSRVFGLPIMLLLLGFIFWLTIFGSNYPSQAIFTFLFWIEDNLVRFFLWLGTPVWVHGVLVLGVYRTLAWVVAVMLPPMAIFFPLFTLLEDLGYLPRVAFNLDNYFKKACCHGKQSLTMCMGFGCNAAGIVGCRIIDSPRERLIAMITNNFVPCNGRFPTLIAIITMFFAGFVYVPFQSFVSALILTSFILFGVFMTFFVSKLLSKTLLKGIPSSFTLELPPYRRPQIGRVIVRSLFDRTLFVLGRAALIAAPAGMVIWILANVQINSVSVLAICANFFDPFAKLIGLDGIILMAFILGFPANEIVVPIIIMSYLAEGNMLEFESLAQLKTLLVNNGWTWLTAICVMLFCLMHWPCGTTCITIKKETKSWKWTIISFLIPTIAGIIVCLVVANTARLFGLV